MKNIPIILFVFLWSSSLFAQEHGIFNEDFEITGVRLIKDCTEGASCLILEAKGRFKHVSYPTIKVEMNGKDISPENNGAFYGLDWMDNSRLLVLLDELPKEIDLKITVGSAFNEEAPLVVFTYKNATKGPTGISSIELKEIGGERILEFAFDGMKEEDFWSYPTYKVEIDGKVVGEKGLSTYGLFKGMKGMVSTKLKKLPKHFKAKIYLGSHGSEENRVFEYEE